MTDSTLKKTLPAAYFEDVYNANDDPWNFTSSEYEAAKYAATLDALPLGKYDSAFEIGCSIGILTEKLAVRCKNLLAVDVNEKALKQARMRCRDLTNVKFEITQIPGEFPDQDFDLILVSEVGYYLEKNDWKLAFDKIAGNLNSSGNVILVHWTPLVADYPQTGDEVHDFFADWADGLFRHIKSLRQEKIPVGCLGKVMITKKIIFAPDLFQH